MTTPPTRPIPTFNTATNQWLLPDDAGGLTVITHDLAQELLAGAGVVGAEGILF